MNDDTNLITVLTALSHLSNAHVASVNADRVTLRESRNVHYGRGAYEIETEEVTFTFAELLDPAFTEPTHLENEMTRRWEEARQASVQAEIERKAQRERAEAAERKRQREEVERTRETREREQLARLKAKYEP